MPHTNNILHFIEIIQGGLIQIKNNVTKEDLQKTQSFIDLVGLDRVPGHAQHSDKDDRWDTRLKVYDLASRQLEKFTSSPPSTDVENIVTIASTSGFFSVWYYIFQGIDEVIDALLNGIQLKGNHFKPFPGTYLPSFDVKNHFTTLPRP